MPERPAPRRYSTGHIILSSLNHLGTPGNHGGLHIRPNRSSQELLQQIEGRKDDRRDKLQTMFQALDKDGDGYLNRDEFMAFLRFTRSDEDLSGNEYASVCEQFRIDVLQGVSEEKLWEMYSELGDMSMVYEDY